jgi:hypothetical protein
MIDSSDSALMSVLTRRNRFLVMLVRFVSSRPQVASPQDCRPPSVPQNILRLKSRNAHRLSY